MIGTTCHDYECPQHKTCKYNIWDFGCPTCPEGHSYMSWSEFNQYKYGRGSRTPLKSVV
ncbi:hypothetical protein KAU33_04350 [Candidatus Dependentiae bacterium]|nr:hypothetical protein [Candidatus Dependentiae bacterium]